MKFVNDGAEWNNSFPEISSHVAQTSFELVM